MSSPSARVPSPSRRYEQVQSSILSIESPSTPDSSMSLLETSDQSIVPSKHSETFQWLKPFDDLCQWTNKTMKITRQYFHERFGQSCRTHDFQLEDQIQNFYQIKIDYENIWNDAQQMIKHFNEIIQTQQKLKECFFDLEQQKMSIDDDLREQFLLNGRSQQILVDRGFKIVDSLKKFVKNLETLITKTMEDTHFTIHRYEKARIEYDAYRMDYENVLIRNPTGGISLSTKEIFIEEKYSRSKEIYEKYQKDLQVKLNLLDENRIKVMKEQLEYFHRTIQNYFSGTF